MGLISQQYRIFVWEVRNDVFRNICDLWAGSEKEALEMLQKQTSRQMTIVEKGPLVAANSGDCQFIARAHSEKQRWPRVDTGRLPQTENANYERAAERGSL